MNLNISEWMLEVFGPHGALGIIVFVALIFFIDALIFPMLPELFFIIGFMYMPDSAIFGMSLLIAASIGEILGVSLLYGIVDRVRIPERIKKIADKYVHFLMVSDEKIFLVNRFAPMIPFVGAFISIIDDWKYSKSMGYIVLGCYVKYGLILMFSGFFYAFFSSDTAQTFTIVMIIAVIAISFVLSFYKKKKTKVDV